MLRIIYGNKNTWIILHLKLKQYHNTDVKEMLLLFYYRGVTNVAERTGCGILKWAKGTSPG